jgi:dihydroneopterin aldolase
MSAERRSSESFFNCTPSERAVFEAGIKLGGIFHQFTGTPVSLKSAVSLEKGMMEAVRSQPYVKVVHIEIDRKILLERCGGEGATGGMTEIGETYTSLTGDMLHVRLTVAFKGKMAVCGMEYVEELDYPLMYVDRIEDICDDEACPP